MIQHVNVGAIIDPAPAQVTISQDKQGHVVDASFDLSSLPRVDSLLLGRPVMEVPALVERLCGICPQAHHLAGTRALESLAGVSDLPPAAQGVRRLLHYGSVIAIHVVGFMPTYPQEALFLRRFSKVVMACAGSPGHFPTTAIPGGVRGHINEEKAAEALALMKEVVEVATRLTQYAWPSSVHDDPFDGGDLALVDDQGSIDLFGDYLRVLDHDGHELIAGARPSDWDSLIAEARPGSAAPQPFLVALGQKSGSYRVGPVAQLRVAGVPTDRAGALQSSWLGRRQQAASARAIIVLHCVEVIEQLLHDKTLRQGELCLDWSDDLPAGVGVGWVDGARGLLVHRYVSDDHCVVESAQILTPTAQNDQWLGSLLTQAATTAVDNSEVMEAAIHEADPCLPCSSAPEGAMGLRVNIEQV